MKNKSKLVLFSFILLFILLSNNVLAEDPDTDGDGIPDSIDSCPTQSETINGFQDTDGCPDVVTATDSDSTTLKSKSEQDNSILQWTAVIASLITAAGAIGVAKFRKSS